VNVCTVSLKIEVSRKLIYDYVNQFEIDNSVEANIIYYFQTDPIPL